MGDAAHLERRKKALICSLLAYCLLLILVVMSFQPSKKTVVIVLSAGSTSSVQWVSCSRVSTGVRKSGARVQRSAIKRSKPKTSSSQIAAEKKTVRSKKVLKNSVLPKKIPQKKCVASRVDTKKQVESTPAPVAKKPVQEIAKKLDLHDLIDKKPKIPEKKIEKPKELTPKPIAVIERAEKIVAVPKQSPRPMQPPVVESQQVVPLVEEKLLVEVEDTGAPDDLVEISMGEGAVPNASLSEGDNDSADGGVSRDECALMAAIGRAWRPPRGLKAGLGARLLVSVSSQGRADRVDIVVSSRVPAYDIAARSSLYRADFPPIFWGKNIAVVFGQNG